MKNMKSTAKGHHVYIFHRSGSYVYVNTDSAGTNISMILGAKRKKREIEEDGNIFWSECGVRGGGGRGGKVWGGLNMVASRIIINR